MNKPDIYSESKTNLYFKSKEDAFLWMEEQGLEGPDNYRFAFLDDHAGMSKYEDEKNHGCCSFFDEEIFVDQRLATIGCNYAH